MSLRIENNMHSPEIIKLQKQNLNDAFYEERDPELTEILRNILATTCKDEVDSLDTIDITDPRIFPYINGTIPFPNTTDDNIASGSSESTKEVESEDVKDEVEAVKTFSDETNSSQNSPNASDNEYTPYFRRAHKPIFIPYCDSKFDPRDYFGTIEYTPKKRSDNKIHRISKKYVAPKTVFSEPMPKKPPFRDTLVGPNAFYNDPDYIANTIKDFAADEPLPPTYRTLSEFRGCALPVFIEYALKVIFFPVILYGVLHTAIYNILHKVVAYLFTLPASNPLHSKRYAGEVRESISLETEWKYKRIGIQADSMDIDVMIMGKPASFKTRRWVFLANDKGSFYEETAAYDVYFKIFLETLNANAIIFNYPGVGATKESPSTENSITACVSIFKFLKDRNDGLNAEEIIFYGDSFGAAIQSKALENHPWYNERMHVFVKKMRLQVCVQ